MAKTPKLGGVPAYKPDHRRVSKPHSENMAAFPLSQSPTVMKPVGH
jgi:hypothetical protein